MNFLRRTHQAEPTDLDAELADTLADRLRAIPPLERPANEFAPDYSLERVAAFLLQHIKELEAARDRLSADEIAVRQHLAEIECRQAVVKIAHETMTRAASELTGKVAELEAPKQTEHEGEAA